MLNGLRAGDGPLIKRLCGADAKTFLRIGQLLQRRLAFTELAIEQLLVLAQGERIIRDPLLAEIESTTALHELIASHCAGDAAIAAAFALALPPDCAADWKVIALTDEIGNPFLAEAEASAAITSAPRSRVASLIPSSAAAFADLDPAVREPVEILIAAPDDDQRAHALERLRYAAPPLAVVTRLMPLLLADGSESVRERAIALCLASGARTVVVDLLRAIARRDSVATARAVSGLAGCEPEQLDLVVAAVMSQMARGAGFPGLAQVSMAVAAHLAHHPLLERWLDLVLASDHDVISVVRAVQADAPARVHGALMTAFGRGPEADATVLILLAGPDGVSGDHDDLCRRALDLLLEPGDAPRARQPLAAALTRIMPDCLAAVAARAAAIIQAKDSAIIWLIADRLRAGPAPQPAIATQLAVACRACLAQPGIQRLACLEQQWPALLPPGSYQVDLALTAFELVASTRDERTCDLIHVNLLAMPTAAIAAAWTMLAGHPATAVRELAATVLADVVGDADAANACERLLTRLTKVAATAERIGLATAAARLAARAGDAALLDRVVAAAEGLDAHAAPVWGACAAAPGVAPDTYRALVQRLMAVLERDPDSAESAPSVDAATGDTTWHISDGVAEHTHVIPPTITAVIAALAAPHALPQVRNHVSDRLRNLWLRVSSFATLWSPANVLELGVGIGRLAGVAAIGAALRLRLLDVLMPRLAQPSVAAVAVQAVLVPGGPLVARYAGRVATTLMQLVGDGRFVDDEWERVVPLLAQLLMASDLGDDAHAIRQRLIYTIAAHHQHLDSRTRIALRHHSWPAEWAERIAGW